MYQPEEDFLMHIAAPISKEKVSESHDWGVSGKNSHRRLTWEKRRWDALGHLSRTSR
jgi:hypothetical protein